MSWQRENFLSVEDTARGPLQIFRMEGLASAPIVEAAAAARLPGLERAMREPTLGLEGLPADLRVVAYDSNPEFDEMLTAVARGETGRCRSLASRRKQVEVLCDTLEFAPPEAKASMVDALLASGDYNVESRRDLPGRCPPIFLALTLPPFPSQALANC